MEESTVCLSSVCNILLHFITSLKQNGTELKYSNEFSLYNRGRRQRVPRCMDLGIYSSD